MNVKIFFIISLALISLSSFALDPSHCDYTHADIPQVSAIASQLSVRCFDYTRQTVPDALKVRDYYSTFEQMCECFQSSPNESVRDLFNKGFKDNSNVNSDDARYQTATAKLSLTNDLVNSLRNGMLFQAHLLSGKDSRLTSSYSQAHSVNETKEIISRANSKILSQFSAQQVSDSEGSLEIGEPQLDRAFLEDDTLEVDECLSMREILTFNQYPRLNNFYQDMATAKFDPNGWNFTTLKEQVALEMNNYKSEINIPGNPHNLEFMKMVVRLRFLTSNPLAKAIFSGPDNAESLNIKSNLFARIQTAYSLPASQCNKNSALGACEASFINSNRPGDLKKDLTDFFLLPDVIKMANDSNDKAISDVIISTPAKTKDPSIQGPVELMTSFTNPHDECINEPNKHLGLCIPLTGKFCKAVPTVLTYKEPDTIDAIDEILNKQMITDEDSNILADSYQESVCKNKRKSANGSADLTYKEYKAKHCSSLPQSPECARGDDGRRKLVSLFLTEYPKSDSDSKDEYFDGYASSLSTFLVKDDLMSSAMTHEKVQALEHSLTTRAEVKQFQEKMRDEYRRNGNRTVDFENSSVARDIERSDLRVMESLRNPVRRDTPVTSAAVMSPEAAAPVQSLMNPVQIASLPVPEIKSQISQAVSRIEKAKSEVKEMETQTGVSRLSDAERSSYQSRLESLRSTISSNTDRLKIYQERLTDLGKAEATSPVTEMKAATPVRTSPTASPQFNAGPTPSVGSGSLTFPIGGGSVGSSFATSTTASFQGTVRPASSSAGASLLVKYNLDRVSADGAIIVADTSSAAGGIDPKLKVEAGKSAELPLTVSEEAYRGFTSRDPEALSVLSDRIRNAPGDVIKLVVQSSVAGKPPLEFYVMKNNGRLLFQPVRRLASLESIFKRQN